MDLHPLQYASKKDGKEARTTRNLTSNSKLSPAVACLPTCHSDPIRTSMLIY